MSELYVLEVGLFQRGNRRDREVIVSCDCRPIVAFDVAIGPSPIAWKVTSEAKNLPSGKKIPARMLKQLGDLAVLMLAGVEPSRCCRVL